MASSRFLLRSYETIGGMKPTDYCQCYLVVEAKPNGSGFAPAISLVTDKLGSRMTDSIPLPGLILVQSASLIAATAQGIASHPIPSDIAISVAARLIFRLRAEEEQVAITLAVFGQVYDVDVPTSRLSPYLIFVPSANEVEVHHQT